MDVDYEKLLSDSDALIRAGQPRQVAALISELTLIKIPRQWRLPLADICRRANLIAEGLRILNFVINDDKAQGVPTAKEIAGYAGLLHKNASISEALRLLEKVDVASAPEALLYRASCHFSRWEYVQSIPLLKSHLELSASPYAALVTKVNLASALITTSQLDEAFQLLNDNIQEATQLSAHRLMGNCFELRANIHLRRDQLDLAEQDLAQAMEKLGEGNASDQLFVLKWAAVLKSRRSGNPESLIEFRKEAVSRRHWETVRETDLFILKTKFDEELFNTLYFGTPFHGYRDRIERELGHKPSISHLRLGSASGPSLDIESGISNPLGLVRPGDKVHQVLAVLWRDLYHPARLGTLFSELFPEEHFNVWSSPNRIHQLMRRTRRTLEKHEVPMEIVEEDGLYRAKLTGPYGIDIPGLPSGVDGDLLLLKQIKDSLGPGSFSALEARQVLNVSQSKISRLFRRGIEKGIVQAEGSGTYVRYKVAS